MRKLVRPSVLQILESPGFDAKNDIRAEIPLGYPETEDARQSQMGPLRKLTYPIELQAFTPQD